MAGSRFSFTACAKPFPGVTLLTEQDKMSMGAWPQSPMVCHPYKKALDPLLEVAFAPDYRWRLNQWSQIITVRYWLLTSCPSGGKVPSQEGWKMAAQENTGNMTEQSCVPCWGEVGSRTKLCCWVSCSLQRVIEWFKVALVQHWKYLYLRSVGNIIKRVMPLILSLLTQCAHLIS